MFFLLAGRAAGHQQAPQHCRSLRQGPAVATMPDAPPEWQPPRPNTSPTPAPPEFEPPRDPGEGRALLRTLQKHHARERMSVLVRARACDTSLAASPVCSDL